MTALSAKLAEVLRLIAEMGAGVAFISGTGRVCIKRPNGTRVAIADAETPHDAVLIAAAVNLVRDPELAGLVNDGLRYRAVLKSANLRGFPYCADLLEKYDQLALSGRDGQGVGNE